MKTRRIQKRINGIARDILREARDDYEFIVIRRRGVSRVRDFCIGRVTNQVAHLARDRSVCDRPLMPAGDRQPRSPSGQGRRKEMTHA